MIKFDFQDLIKTYLEKDPKEWSEAEYKKFVCMIHKIGDSEGFAKAFAAAVNNYLLQKRHECDFNKPIKLRIGFTIEKSDQEGWWAVVEESGSHVGYVDYHTMRKIIKDNNVIFTLDGMEDYDFTNGDEEVLEGTFVL